VTGGGASAKCSQAVVIHLGTNDNGCVLQNAMGIGCRYPDFDLEDLLRRSEAYVRCSLVPTPPAHRRAPARQHGRWCYGRSRSSMRGNGTVSRTWRMPVSHVTQRSMPMPKPACGTEP
jgi:hypothetical protein